VPLSGGKVKLKSLKGHPMIGLSEQEPVGQAARTLLFEEGLKPDMRVVAQNHSLAGDLAGKGLGFALLDGIAAERTRKLTGNVRVVAIHGAPEIDITAILARAENLTSAPRRFIELCAEALTKEDQGDAPGAITSVKGCINAVYASGDIIAFINFVSIIGRRLRCQARKGGDGMRAAPWISAKAFAFFRCCFFVSERQPACKRLRRRQRLPARSPTARVPATWVSRRVFFRPVPSMPSRMCLACWWGR
jgi:hypothetical protein